jgi:DNA-directed RNA polymerase subunit RPC12/RpoP
MHDELAIDFQDLTTVYITCPHQGCGTELAFDLTQGQAPRRIVCPNCNDDLLEVQQQQNFRFTWISLLKTLRDGNARPRMIFRIPRPHA